jgi:hypothetical protein
MTIEKQRLRQIIKEEMDRAMNEMTDDEYNAYLQRQHGRFTTPENVRGTPEYERKNAPRPPAPKPSYNYYGGGGGGYSEYDSLYYGPGINEGDGDPDMDMMDDSAEMDFEVEDDGMGEMMPEAEPVAEEIDWTQFEDDDAEAVGAAFMDAIKQLREEAPDEEPTAAAVVALMQDMLSGGEDEEAEMDSEEMESGEEPLNEWIRRTNLLAGTRRR